MVAKPVSCGTIFFAQLIAAYAPPSFVESDLVAWTLRALAPAAALAVECAVPLLLAARPERKVVRLQRCVQLEARW